MLGFLAGLIVADLANGDYPEEVKALVKEKEKWKKTSGWWEYRYDRLKSKHDQMVKEYKKDKAELNAYKSKHMLFINAYEKKEK